MQFELGKRSECAKRRIREVDSRRGSKQWYHDLSECEVMGYPPGVVPHMREWFQKCNFGDKFPNDITFDYEQEGAKRIQRSPSGLVQEYDPARVGG